MSNPRIFISYGHEDSDWAQALSRALADRSVDVWIDSSQLQAGKDWQRALTRGLRDSDVYAIVIGRRALSNSNVMFELGVASATGRPVIPIILSSASAPDLLTGLANIHQVRTDDVQTAADELKRVAEQSKRSA